MHDAHGGHTGNEEDDFALREETVSAAIEVKSGHEARRSGMAVLLQKSPKTRRTVAGGTPQGTRSAEEFPIDETPVRRALKNLLVVAGRQKGII